MSAKRTEEEENERNGTSKKGANIGKECLDLMRFNYENLDRAVWKAHQFWWFMTSIFVPVIFGGLGYLLKDLDDISVPGIVIGAIVVVGITWFWYAITEILDGYNRRRFKQLRRLEEVFDGKYGPEELVRKEMQFVQYRRLPGERSRMRFRHATLAFAIFLTVVSALAAIAKIEL
ncbi:MAG: RipA family octameric membrane protein [Planctomycetota bacterium]